MPSTAASRGRREPATSVPHALQVAGAVCWRFLLIAAALVVLGVIIVQLRVVIIPIAIALLLAALLAPAVGWLSRHRVPRGLATVVVLVGGLAALGGLLTFVIQAFVDGLPDLRAQVGQVIEQLRGWLASGPFGLAPIDLNSTLDAIAASVQNNRARITSGALGAAATVGELLAGTFLALFTLIFFLYDGARIWRFLLGAVPQNTRPRVDVAGQRAFASLVGYTRATVLVAIVDAVGIGLGLYLVGVPLVIPLTALVFLGAFIPTVGAIVTGIIATAVALVANGAVAALIVLAVVIAVQQLEGHVLQPLLLGRAVRLHPLAVVLPVAAGVVLAGITGALLAVPIVAMINAAVRSLSSEADADVHPAEVDPTDAEHSAPNLTLKSPPSPVTDRVADGAPLATSDDADVGDRETTARPPDQAGSAGRS